MTLSTHYFVPMAVEALCVSAPMTIPENGRWAMKYDNLAGFATAEPGLYDPEVADVGRDPGIYLSWTLPPGLRTASQQADGRMAFPYIPNRYLVVRSQTDAQGTRSAMAWLILADGQGVGEDPDDKDTVCASTAFLDPSCQDTPVATSIGIKIPAHRYSPDLHQSAFGDYALDATGGGNPAFSIFTPHNENVLSMYDPVASSHPEGCRPPPDRDLVERSEFSYTVLGWYSREDIEPLAGLSGDLLTKKLADLDWRWWYRGGAPEPGAKLLVAGHLGGVKWDRREAIPSPVPASGSIKVALAPTLMEGLDTLLAAHAPAGSALAALYGSSHGAGFAELLHRQVEQHGEALSRDRHARAFGSVSGEVRYVFAQLSASDGRKEVIAASPQDQEALGRLKKLETERAGHGRRLEALRRQRQDLSWKRAVLDGNGVEPDFGTTADSDFMKSRLKAAADDLDAQIQAGEKALAAASDEVDKAAAALRKNLDPRLELRASGAGRFYQAQDPLLILSGGRGALTRRTDDPLLFGKEGVAIGPIVPAAGEKSYAWIDAAPWDALKDAAPVEQLRALFELLGDGPAPEYYQPACRPWYQPWSPLFLEWSLVYCDVPLHSRSGPGNWRFDGRDFSLHTETPADTITTTSISRRSHLAPAVREVLRTELRRVLADQEIDPGEIEKRVGALEDWDFLSQRLDGLLDIHRCRDRRLNYLPQADGVRPPDDYPGIPVPDLKELPSGDKNLFDSCRFRQMSGGQFRIERITLVDRYGQVVPIAGEWRSGPGRKLTEENCFVAPSFRPNYDLEELRQHIWSPAAQMPPRLLQAARTVFETRNVGTGNGPVAGWWTWNRYNRALMVHDPDGNWLGMVHTGALQGAVFEPAPGGRDLSALEQTLPELAGLLRQLVTAGDSRQRFDALGELLDEAGWRIDPADEHGAWLSVMTGRPLAIVGASLAFELEGPPSRDPSWAFSFGDEELPDVLADLRRRVDAIALPSPLEKPLPILVGNPDDHEEGLVGLWLGEDVSTMLSPYASREGAGLALLSPDRPLYHSFSDQTALRLLLLVDPFATVYAASGILPDQALSLPPSLFEPALRAMAPVFPMGPLLAEREEPGSHDHDDAAGRHVEPLPLLYMPVPPSDAGDWRWMDGDGRQYAVRSPGNEAHLSGRPLEIREGLLQLVPLGQK
ncbi:MAG TPA: hypothetical protein VFF03_02305 [Rhodocyclaceae bacterium]|nr:hypothetical protein [Rhodocyclaceae bacterium]